MGNSIEYECGTCDYYEYVHSIPFEGGEKRSIYSKKFRDKCCHCTKGMVERLQGKGIYPQAEGGFTIKEE